MTRPRDIGTQAETAFVNLLKRSGWPDAERRPGNGRFDRGDVTCGNPELVFEVKGGKNRHIPEWMRETETERVRATASWGFLIWKREGVGYPNAHNWWAFVDKEQWDQFQKTHEADLTGTAIEFLNTTLRKHTIANAMMQAQATRSERMAMDGMEEYLDQMTWYTGVWFTGLAGTRDFFALRVDDLLDILRRCGYSRAPVKEDQ